MNYIKFLLEFPTSDLIIVHDQNEPGPGIILDVKLSGGTMMKVGAEYMDREGQGIINIESWSAFKKILENSVYYYRRVVDDKIDKFEAILNKHPLCRVTYKHGQEFTILKLKDRFFEMALNDIDVDSYGVPTAPSVTQVNIEHFINDVRYIHSAPITTTCQTPNLKGSVLLYNGDEDRVNEIWTEIKKLETELRSLKRENLFNGKG